MFNDEQLGHMKYLASLPKEKKCDCGWYERGGCFGSCFQFKDKGGGPKLKYYCPKHKRYVDRTMGRKCSEAAVNWIGTCLAELTIEEEWKTDV